MFAPRRPCGCSTPGTANSAKPTAGQNQFGSNLTGFLVPGKIAGVSPFSAGKVPVINPKFPQAFYRTLYNVVNFNANTKDDVGKSSSIASSKVCH